MNKVFEPFLGLFLRVFIDDFGVYNDRASHLTKLELVFQLLEGSRVTLSPEKTTIDFSEGRMVGHIVSKDGVATILEILIGFQSFLSPQQRKPYEVFWGWWATIEGSYTCLQQKHVL